MTNSLNLPTNPSHNTTFSQFGVTYTYDSVNDVWTANASPTIDDMVDVDTTTIAPTANQVLSWDVSTNNFIPTDGFAAQLSASTTDDVSEASNLYFTTARARNSISVSGDLSYNSATGVISYTDPLIIDWSAVQNTPTTIAGYGITDAYTIAQVDNAINTIELTPGPQGATGPSGSAGPSGPGLSAGAVIYHASSTPPTGFIKANGASLSTSTYAALFAAIGYTFGGSGGSFNVPDLRGEFLRGWDDSRGVDSGRSFGSAQADEFKSHTHTGSSLAAGTIWLSRYQLSGGTWPNERDGNTSGTGSPTGATGGTETRPRNVALLACIKY
jgi:microcystin-dependent protein